MCLTLRSGVEKEHRLCNQSDLGLTAGMAITSSMSLQKLLHFSEPPLPYLENGDASSTLRSV